MGHEGTSTHGARARHEHGHEHEHEHDARAGARTRGARRAARARGKVLFLDAPSGLAGDMIVAALVDLGVPRSVVADALAALPVDRFHVHFGTRVRSGIVACAFDVHVDEPQPARTYGTIRAMLEEARAAPRA